MEKEYKTEIISFAGKQYSVYSSVEDPVDFNIDELGSCSKDFTFRDSSLTTIESAILGTPFDQSGGYFKLQHQWNYIRFDNIPLTYRAITPEKANNFLCSSGWEPLYWYCLRDYMVKRVSFLKKGIIDYTDRCKEILLHEEMLKDLQKVYGTGKRDVKDSNFEYRLGTRAGGVIDIWIQIDRNAFRIQAVEGRKHFGYVLYEYSSSLQKIKDLIECNFTEGYKYIIHTWTDDALPVEGKDYEMLKEAVLQVYKNADVKSAMDAWIGSTLTIYSSRLETEKSDLVRDFDVLSGQIVCVVEAGLLYRYRVQRGY